jgi:hypothetical protein
MMKIELQADQKAKQKSKNKKIISLKSKKIIYQLLNKILKKKNFKKMILIQMKI